MATVTERNRVLIVDDEPGIQVVLQEVLSVEGFEARIASDGYEALNILLEWRPDVIVLDLMMPAMDGVAFRRAQSQLSDDLNAIPVVVVSGARDNLKRAESVAAAAVFSKPFDLDDVVAAIRQVIDEHSR